MGVAYSVYLAAFEQHRNGRSIAQFREDTAGMIVKMQVTKCFVQAG